MSLPMRLYQHHHHKLYMMKRFIFLLLATSLAVSVWSQQTGGRIVRKQFTAVSLQQNKVGENPVRHLSVYLPPGYDKSKQRYPVIYFLHGYGGNDSLMMHSWLQTKKLLDTAILTGKMRPMILVTPDSETRLGGSFYSNTAISGNWADYIAKDVVRFVDINFRTLAHRDSRGLAGHSMGGNGALKIGMMYTDIFGAVYGMSPAVLNWAAEFTLENKAFIYAANATDEQTVMQGMVDFNGFYTAVIAALARAYTPNTSDKKLHADFPVIISGDSILVNMPVKQLWDAQLPFNMVDRYVNELKTLNALKLDWGRNEEFLHIPVTGLQFSKKLEQLGIKHFAEEYLGNHTNMQDGFEGRFYTETLPFFEKYLK